LDAVAALRGLLERVVPFALLLVIIRPYLLGPLFLLFAK
jgi:hypothetical protein